MKTSKDDLKAQAIGISSAMTKWLGVEGWKKHFIEVIDFLYPKAPKHCKNMREVKEYKKDRERFIKLAKEFFNIV